MSKSREKEAATALVERLSIQQRQHLLASILSNEDLFATARLKLKPHVFNEFGEVGFLAIWTSALKLAELHGSGCLFENRKQAWQLLDTETKTLFQQRPDIFNLQFWDEAFGDNGFLPWLYDTCTPEEFHPAYGVRLLMKFLNEREINDPLQRLMQAAASSVVADIPDVVAKFRDKHRDLCALSINPVRSGAPEGWSPPEIIRHRTTIPWLDTFLNGGHRAGETYFVAGATGAGKTTLGVQLALGVAADEVFLSSGDKILAEPVLEEMGWDITKPYPCGDAYYFHYEMSEDDVRKKAWSASAMIDYDKIERLGTRTGALSQDVNLSKAEAALLLPLGDVVDLSKFAGEAQRLEDAKRRLNKNFWQVDCSGKTPGVGAGYIAEIAGIIGAEVRRGKKIAVVVIDYASACVEQHTSDKDLIYLLLSQFGRRAEAEIAEPFQTPVWILQQLSGESNRRTAATKQHHADAAGCKSMGNACWFAFTIGTSDEKSGCRIFTCSKARRKDLGSPPVLKIAGGFNRLIDVSREFAFDRLGRVISKDAAAEAKKKEKKDTPSEAETAASSQTVESANASSNTAAAAPAVAEATPVDDGQPQKLRPASDLAAQRKAANDQALT
jgi:hypothetical protein